MLKKFFNWCADKPSRQYTLNELVPGCGKYSLKFNRAARFAERFTTLPFLAAGAFIAVAGVPAIAVGAPVATAGAVAVGGLVVAWGKVQGLVNGAIVHLAAKGISGVANHLAANAKKEKPAPAVRIEPTL